MSIQIKVRVRCPAVLFNHSPPVPRLVYCYCVEIGPLTKPRAYPFSQAGWPINFKDSLHLCLSHPCQIIDVPFSVPWFYTGSGDPNSVSFLCSRPVPCVVSPHPLPPKPSSAPSSWFYDLVWGVVLRWDLVSPPIYPRPQVLGLQVCTTNHGEFQKFHSVASCHCCFWVCKVTVHHARKTGNKRRKTGSSSQQPDFPDGLTSQNAITSQ